MKKTFVLILLSCLLGLGTAWAQRVEWIKQFGGIGADKVDGFLQDKDGNFVVWGTFQNAIKLGTIELKAANTEWNGFIAGFDNKGLPKWAKNLKTRLDTCRLAPDKSLFIIEQTKYGYAYISKLDIKTGTESWSYKSVGFYGILGFDESSALYTHRLRDENGNMNADLYTFAPNGDLKIFPRTDRVGYGDLYGLYSLKHDVFATFYTRQKESTVEYTTQLLLDNYALNQQIFSSVEMAPNTVAYSPAISKSKKIGVLLSTNDKFTIDDAVFYTKGAIDLYILQFDSQAKLEWKRQIGGKGDDVQFLCQYTDDNQLCLGIQTTEAFEIDGHTINQGKQLVYFGADGTVQRVEPYIEPQQAPSVFLLDKKIPLDADGLGYTFGTINEHLDTLTSLGSSDIFFAKVNCQPAFLKAIAGPATACKDALNAYTTELHPGMSYKWETDKPSAISNSEIPNGINITFLEKGTCRIKATPSNRCGTGEPIFYTVEVNDKPGAVSAIAGDTVTCSGVKAYSIAAISSGSANWSLDGGGTLIADKHNATINWHTPGYYSISASQYNECGAGPASTQQVLVQTAPEQPAAITGNTSVCRGTETYIIETQPETAYDWYINTGGQITGAQNKASVNWLTPGTHRLLVTARNTCGTSLPQTLPVTVKDVPARPMPIIGESKSCVGRLVYSAEKIPNLKYTWTLNGGGKLSASENMAEVDWAVPGTFTLKLTQSNECGAGAPALLSVKILDKPGVLDSIVGLGSVCQGQQIYAVAQRPDEEYKWELGGGGLLLPKGNKASIEWSKAGAYTLSVSPFNQCGMGTPASRIITVSASAAKIGAIVGADKPCLGEETYTVKAVEGLAYTWSLGSGGTLSSSANNATVKWDKIGVHTLQLATSDNCSISLIAQAMDKPARPSAIRGDAQVCAGLASYDVEAVPQAAYLWKLSGGGTLAPMLNSTNVEWQAAGVYQLAVVASNACGTSDTSRLDVKSLQAPAAPSLIDGKERACVGTSEYRIALIPDASYNWWLSNAGGIIASKNNAASVEWQYAHENILNISAHNICGTSPTRSLPILVKSRPVQPDIIGDSLACTGKGIYLVRPQAETEYSWQLLSGGALSAKKDSAFVEWKSAGNHIISVTPSSFCGIGQPALRSITVNTLPSVSDTISGKNASCQGMEFYSIPSHSGIHYEWAASSGGSLVSLSSSARVFWTGAGKQSLTLRPRNECGAGTPITKRVFVNTIPDSASIISGTRLSCTGSQGYEVQAAPGVSYSWLLPSGGAISGTGSKVAVGWKERGYHTLSVVPSNACGSGPARSATVQVLAVPARPQLNAADTLACLSSTTRLYAQQQEAAAYHWALADAEAGVLAASGESVSIEWKKAGAQKLTLAASNQCGQSPSQEHTVRVRTKPEANHPIIGEKALCLGTSAYQIENPGKNAISWNINGGGFLSAQGNTAKIDWFTAGTFTITATPSNQCGNGTAQSFGVEVLSAPQQPASISYSTIACLNAPTLLKVNTQPGIGAQYIWATDTSGSISSAAADQASAIFRQAGTHIVTLIPRNRCGDGPMASASLYIASPPRPIAEIIGDSSLCINNGSRYAVPAEQGVSYHWSVSNEGTLAQEDNFARLESANPGAYLLSLSARNACGEIHAPSKIVQIKALPTRKLEITGAAETCLGNKEYSVQAEGCSIAWNINGGGALSNAGPRSTVAWNSPGLYLITAQESNLCGSGPVASKEVSVLGAPALPFSIDGPAEACIGSPAAFASLALPNTSYRWEVAGNPSDTAYKAATGNAVSLQWAQPGKAQISLSSYNQCGQSQKRYAEVLVHAPLPKQAFQIIGEDTLCQRTTSVYSTSLINHYQWKWMISPQFTSASYQNSMQIDWDSAGAYLVSATPYNACGTGDTATIKVAVEAPLERPLISYKGDSLSVKSTGTILWYKDYFLLDNVAASSISQPAAGYYVAQAENSCGLSQFSDTAYLASPEWMNSSMKIYPNPAVEQYITVEFPDNYEWLSFEIRNQLGQPLGEYFNQGSRIVTVTISQLASGSYYIWTNGGQVDLYGTFVKK